MTNSNYQLLPNNQEIIFSGKEILDIYREIEFILMGLADISRAYSVNSAENFDKKNYEQATTAFIDNGNVSLKLAEIRRLLSEKFDRSLGDEMDDIERAMFSLEYWQINQ